MAKRKTSKPDFDQMADVGKLVADATRLRIITFLSQGPQCVGAICAELNLPQPTVSHHLGLLRMRQLVENQRNGKQVIYSMASPSDAVKGLQTLLAAV